MCECADVETLDGTFLQLQIGYSCFDEYIDDIFVGEYIDELVEVDCRFH